VFTQGSGRPYPLVPKSSHQLPRLQTPLTPPAKSSSLQWTRRRNAQVAADSQDLGTAGQRWWMSELSNADVSLDPNGFDLIPKFPMIYESVWVDRMRSVTAFFTPIPFPIHPIKMPVCSKALIKALANRTRLPSLLTRTCGCWYWAQPSDKSERQATF